MRTLRWLSGAGSCRLCAGWAELAPYGAYRRYRIADGADRPYWMSDEPDRAPIGAQGPYWQSEVRARHLSKDS